MACKIADPAAIIESVSWQSSSVLVDAAVTRKPPVVTLPAPALPPGAEEAREAELAAARKQGFQDGLRKGKEEAGAEWKATLDRAASSLRDLASLKRKLRAEAETDLVKLSLAIARRVLHREISADPESLAGIVHAALDKLNGREMSRVRTSPVFADTVKSALERAGAAVAVVPDPKLKPGDLIFETAFGELDASVDAQMREIERGFADRLGLR